MSSFIKIPYILSSQFPHTLEDGTAIVLTLDLSFVQNLPEEDKMELASYLTHNMFKVGNIFSLVSVGQSDVLAP